MTSQEVIIVETDSSKLEECKSPKEYLNKLYKSSVEDETKADLQVFIIANGKAKAAYIIGLR